MPGDARCVMDSRENSEAGTVFEAARFKAQFKPQRACRDHPRWCVDVYFVPKSTPVEAITELTPLININEAESISIFLIFIIISPFRKLFRGYLQENENRLWVLPPGSAFSFIYGFEIILECITHTSVE